MRSGISWLCRSTARRAAARDAACNWHQRGRRPFILPLRVRFFVGAIGVFLCVAGVRLAVIVSQTQPPATAATDARKDPLGRTTPRGTVLGFLNAARKGDDELARQYLNATMSEAAAKALGHQLFVVLDARLSARLTLLSDAPEGSLANPLRPNQEIVGSVESQGGPVRIIVERVERPEIGAIWLFSKSTLAAVPTLYGEVEDEESSVPHPLLNLHIAGLRLIEWLAILLALPGFYAAIRLLARTRLPLPARVLMVSVAARLLLHWLPLSLITRQLLSSAISLSAIIAVTWLLILAGGIAERTLSRGLTGPNVIAVASLLRVGRRLVDLLIVFVALLAILRRFGVDPTPIVAGLGVGGIAVALAAQKTLENVIGGASLILDQAVRPGDFLQVGTTQGTVDYVGLRSTRIRTLDRTIVSVPNGQIATMSLETLSSRDKFWFHPIVPLRYDTSSDQLRAVLAGIRHRLLDHPSIQPDSVRVRWLRLGTFSLDVEVVAYVSARDWSHFLELQEQLLFSVLDVITQAGTAIAIPYCCQPPPNAR